MPKKRKPPIGLRNFVTAMLIGGFSGFIIGLLTVSLGFDFVMDYLLIQYDPRYAWVLWLGTPGVCAIAGAIATGTLLYKWERFRFFIG